MPVLLPRTLGFRLTFTYACAFVLLLSITLILLYLSIASVMNQQMDADLFEDVEEFSVLYGEGTDEAIVREIDRETQAGGSESVFLMLFDSDGSLLYSSDLTHWKDLKVDSNTVREVARSGNPGVLRTLEIDGQEAETRVIYGALTADRVLYLGESLEERDEIMELLPVLFAGVFVVGILIASTIVWWLTQRALHGITAVSNAARDIRYGDLERRVGIHGQVEEVQNLADTFDGMAVRIQQLITDMRDMTDNIAHDLRSPLARIRVACESVLQPDREIAEFREAARATIEECDRLIRMINISLDVSEAEAGVTRTTRESVDYSDLVAAACELFGTVAESRDITLESRIDSGCRVHGIPDSLQRMTANVIDNAIKFSDGGDTISVSLEEATGEAVLTVSDTGIGITQNALEHVFDRFYRGDSSRSVAGSGLGLSYARAVARLHGGDIEVSSLSNAGSVFRISLPLERKPALKPMWSRPAGRTAGPRGATV